ncbi:MAG: gamma-glutamylcyclotransferase [Emcibacteraceae bacterium]|nr:gamma-glutamylcyclotransferase [Emcibacteraceae bacterium]
MVTAFFYGLFLDPYILKSLNIKHKNFRIAKLQGYDLIIGERANLKKEKTSHVWGSIMDIKEEDIKALYSAKSVNEYCPYKVECQLINGETLPAVVYLLPPEYNIKPAKDNQYAQQLLGICKKYKLPQEHISKIETIMEQINANTS